MRGYWSRQNSRAHHGRAATAAAVLSAVLAVVGCSSSAPAPVTEPNILPANYKNQIAEYLETVLTDRADFRNSLIAAPALKQVGDSQHYVACVQLNGRNQHKDKAVIYLAGSINQFVDASGDQCTGVAYEPFKELAKLTP